MNFEPSGYFHTCTCMYTYMYIHPVPGTTSIPYTLYSMHPDIIDQLMLCKYFVIVHASTSHSQRLGHPPRIHIHAHVHVRVNYVRTCVCVCVPFIPSYDLYCYVRCVFGKQRHMYMYGV